MNEISESELSSLDKRDDGKFEILNVKLDNRKTRNLDSKNKNNENKKINKLLSYLSKTYKKKVVICIHPKDNLNKKKKIYSNYKVVKYATKENIFKAFLVFFFDSSAIVDAINKQPSMPDKLNKVFDQNEKMTILDNDTNLIKSYILGLI